ncbi:MAG: hypothetical protein Q7K45_04005 [Nanoarchaeota archaeon]|nr:hypothetical protein [Nanoarchaeota archaeon]
MIKPIWYAKPTYAKMLDILDRLVLDGPFQAYEVNTESNITCEALNISKLGGIDGYSESFQRYTVKDLNPFLRTFFTQARTDPHLKIENLELYLDAPENIRDRYGVKDTKMDGLPIRVNVDVVPLRVIIATPKRPFDFAVYCKEFERLGYENKETNRRYQHAHQRWEKTVQSKVIEILGAQKKSSR